MNFCFLGLKNLTNVDLLLFENSTNLTNSQLNLQILNITF